MYHRTSGVARALVGTCAGFQIVLCATNAVAQEEWIARDLGTPGFRLGSGAYDINNAGYVVGVGSGDEYRTPAFVWSAQTGMRILEIDPRCFCTSEARAINDIGQIAGTYYDYYRGGSTYRRAVVWNVTAALPPGTQSGLGTLGGTWSEAYGINNAGQVVGRSETSSGDVHAFISSSAEGMRSLDGGNLDSLAYGINDSGQVVGVRGNHAFLWTEATGMLDLGTLGGSSSYARAINNAGQVVGYSRAASGAVHAFLWTAAAGMQDLGTLGGSDSYANAINNAGVVVGQSETASGAVHAFRWTAATGMQDLGWLGTAPMFVYGINGINDAGEVVGASTVTSSGMGMRATLWSGPWNDLALDFGPGVGLWTAHQPGIWRPVHKESADATATADLDGNGLDDLVVDFGAYGVYAWMNQAAWMFVHPANPTQMSSGDFDGNGQDDVVFDFPGHGLWRLDNFTSWAPLHELSPARLAVGNVDGIGGDELLVSFAGAGLWRYGQDAGWTLLHGSDVTQLLTADIDDNGADDVVMAFAGEGVWSHVNEMTWVHLHWRDPAHIAAGDMDADGADDLVFDFSHGVGIWLVINGTTSMPLHWSLSSEALVVADLDGNGIDEVVVDFGEGIGVWTYLNGAAWQHLHTLSPRTLTAGRFH
jgi:probable HAF family extracellular repeat protein